jgi:DNA-binding NarL/FixJ family response regulator
MARTRTLMAQACRDLGDDEGAGLEWDAATRLFDELGVKRSAELMRPSPSQETSAIGNPLTSRELEVLRLVAEGMTNKSIAAELHLSERTIDRHVSNILAKMDVPSRAAATAYAYRHQLL